MRHTDYPSALSLSRQGIVIDYWEHPVVKYRQGGVSSPARFNSVYEKDSDEILRREILPYVNLKFLVKLRYYFWKFKRSQDSRFAYEYSLIYVEKRNIKRLLLLIRHPVQGLRILKRKLSGRYKTGR